MIQQDSKLVNAHPAGRWTALHQAANVSSIRSAVSLLFPFCFGSVPLLCRFCFAPLRAAAIADLLPDLLLPAQGNVKEVVEYLLHVKADVNIKNRDGKFAQDPRRLAGFSV